MGRLRSLSEVEAHLLLKATREMTGWRRRLSDLRQTAGAAAAVTSMLLGAMAALAAVEGGATRPVLSLPEVAAYSRKGMMADKAGGI